MVPKEIDLVYLWVDGNDPEWKRKHNAAVGKTDEKPAVDGKGRYVDNSELKFSLRSVEKYAPWIRRIFIVTDNQVPSWLNVDNPKIQIVDHKDILPESVLPTFNANTLEHAIFRIPGLGEHFLFANDDTFLNREVTPGDFFTDDGKPIVRLNRRPFRKLNLWLRRKVLGKPMSNYNTIVQNSARLIEKTYGKYFSGKAHHNIDSYCRSDYEAVYENFRDRIEPTLVNKIRSSEDLQRSLYSYAFMAERKCQPEYVGDRTSFRLHIHNRKLYEKFNRLNPVFFCMNDSEYASDEDRRYVGEFLNGLFPDKSQFEL